LANEAGNGLLFSRSTVSNSPPRRICYTLVEQTSPIPSSMKQRLSSLYLYALGIAAAIPLFFHAYLGAYSRLIADDFCTAFQARQLGILRATWYWYRTWTGRYAATLLDSIFGILGPGLTPFVTSIVLVAWLTLLAWAVFSMLPPFKNRLISSVVLATVILTMTFLLSPNVPQALYWGQGMRSVVPPLMLSAAYLALFRLYQRRSWRPVQQGCWFIVAFMAAFVVGGFSETFTAAQILVLGCAVLWAFFTYFQRQPTLMLCAAFGGAVLALIVVIIAPGNAVRQATYPPSPNLLEILRISIMGYGVFWSKLLGSAQNIAGLLGLIGLAIFLGSKLGHPTHKVRIAVLILLAGLVLTFACFPPAAYGTSDYPPERTQILPVHFLLIAIALCGLVTGQWLSTRAWSKSAIPFLAAATLALVLYASLVSANQLYAARDQYINYAQEWDQTDGLIHAAHLRGEKEVTVTNHENWTHLNVLGDNPKFWVNICYSGYYDMQVFGVVPATQ
jgi:hypothetical protein